MANQLSDLHLHQVDLPVDLNGNCRFVLFELILADQLADLPPPWVDLPVHLNGNFTFLLSELILADLSDKRSAICTDTYTESLGRPGGRSTPQQIYHPPILACSGNEWWFHISTVRAHIGRSTGRCTTTPPTPIEASSCIIGLS